MNIATIPISKLNPAEYNPRVITKDEFSGLVESLKTFGQQENLIVNKDMTVISGHQRLEAMKALGWEEAVCNVVDLDKHAEKKLNVIMNSHAISGKYDDILLGEILEELKLDDDYEALRLNELEPLDFSDLGTDFDLPDGEKEPFGQMSFQLAEAQIQTIHEALGMASDINGETFGNENSNGNKLYWIVEQWLRK